MNIRKNASAICRAPAQKRAGNAAAAPAAQMGNHLVSCCGCNAGDDLTAVGPAPTKPTEADEEDRRHFFPNA